jgi:hypothetical protein
MERLFSPCTRLRDIVNLLPPGGLQELNLDISTEELLSAERGFTYEALHAMIRDGHTIAWLTPHASVVRANTYAENCWVQLPASYRFYVFVDGNNTLAFARSPEHLLEICDVVLRLLAVSVVHSVTLYNVDSCDGALISSTTLAYLMEQCQSLKVLMVHHLFLDENHCGVLGVYSRPDLEIELIGCKLTSAGAGALAEVLRRNQGPTKLDCCDIDYCATADGLRGNSRLKSLKQDFSGDFSVCNRQVLAIADAVRENKGLAELNLRCYGFNAINEETWGAVCDSLKTHLTLEVLNLQMTGRPLNVIIISRMRALVDMISVNTSIHTIWLDDHYSQHKLYQESIIPYLETNRFRLRLLAIQKTRSIPYRAKVLGRALLAARTDANRFWMLLSGNAEVALPSRTTTIAAAANLPTPATIAATSTANVAAVAAFEMPALRTTATDSLPAAAATSADTLSTLSALDAFASTPTVAAAANAATLSAGQKRKASR